MRSTLHPSCPHPAGDDAPLSIASPEAKGITAKLAIAGYAAQHAPTPEQGHMIGSLALRIREFDRGNR